MVAVAIYAVRDGKELSDKDKELVGNPVCSGELGELNKDELAETKKAITSAMKYIKGYNGPSKTWNAYQNSLDEGVSRLSELVSELPASKQTTKLLVDRIYLKGTAFARRSPPGRRGDLLIINMQYVYILKCSDGYPYVGCSSDLKDRINRLPIKLVFYASFSNKYKAFEFEKLIK